MRQGTPNMQGAKALTRRSFSKLACAGALSLLSGAWLSGCDGPLGYFSGTQTVTDHVGRTLDIPATSRLTSIYFTSPLAQIFCFTIAPDLIAGTSINFDREQLNYLPESTEKLDFMGSLSGGGSIDQEMLRIKNVQLMFSISGTDLTDVNVEDAVELQERSGIPVVLIDGSFDRIRESYELLGQCLGRRERAEELGNYCDRVLQQVSEAVAQVPDDKLVSYYFAEGVEGLWTEPDVSQHSLAFQVARGINVAGDIDPSEPERKVSFGSDNRNMAAVTLDEVKRWDPDYIICWDFDKREGAVDIITHSDEWSVLSAVRKKRVYSMPSLPFAFVDRPPGVNRFLGIQWLANLFYPEYYKVDMVDAVREFYSVCYWRDITPEEARRVLDV